MVSIHVNNVNPSDKNSLSNSLAIYGMVVGWLNYLMTHTYSGGGLKSSSSRFGKNLLIFNAKNLLTPTPSTIRKGKRIELIAIPAVAEVENLKALKLMTTIMTNKTAVSNLLIKSFLYGWIQM